MDKKKIKEIEEAISDEFGDNYAISQKHLCYFNTFYQAVDFWSKNYDKPNVTKTKKFKDKVNFIKSFFYSGNYSMDKWVPTKQSKYDKKTARELGLPDDLYEIYTSSNIETEK